MKKIIALVSVLFLLTGCGSKKMITCEREQTYSNGNIAKSNEIIKFELSKDKIVGGKLVSSITLNDNQTDEQIEELKTNNENVCKDEINIGMYDSCVTTRKGNVLTVTAVFSDKGAKEENDYIHGLYDEDIKKGETKDTFDIYAVKSFSSRYESECVLK